MLQIITGRFFKTGELNVTSQRTALYSNYRGHNSIDTLAGSYAPTAPSSDITSAVYSVEQKLEAARSDGLTNIIIAVHPEALAEDFAALLSFCLQVTCTLDPTLVSRLSRPRPLLFSLGPRFRRSGPLFRNSRPLFLWKSPFFLSLRPRIFRLNHQGARPGPRSARSRPLLGAFHPLWGRYLPSRGWDRTYRGPDRPLRGRDGPQRGRLPSPSRTRASLSGMEPSPSWARRENQGMLRAPKRARSALFGEGTIPKRDSTFPARDGTIPKRGAQRTKSADISIPDPAPGQSGIR